MNFRAVRSEIGQARNHAPVVDLLQVVSPNPKVEEIAHQDDASSTVRQPLEVAKKRREVRIGPIQMNVPHEYEVATGVQGTTLEMP
jgi:hypothetical protein